ncbi:hypothetical protein SAMN02745194_03876 [Roseomonas rosea]|uniref:DUF429 domain-containing protein n=1 Tax=Muricoccus roseus TaxID=198092 RepID=A0A1M6NRW0_9PROT|nr:hypothetical protein SAMN02745194_03876 [Roseomonas rosea]
MEHFVGELFSGPLPTLAGFDFPVGMPVQVGRRTGFSGFSEAIDQFGLGPWARFYDVSEEAQDISLHRPFYPRVSSSSARQAHLLSALGVEHMDALRRECERATSDRRAACSLFWTLGGNQVGKAAISGWRDVVQPARRAGALLWPFDVAALSSVEQGSVVLCETYPAEAYGHVGVRFRRGGSKQRQEDRRAATAGLGQRCERHGVRLSSDMVAVLTDGFGPRKDGEDAFDATIGLMGMIEVVEGRRAPAPGVRQAPEWEGWILGQTA